MSQMAIEILRAFDAQPIRELAELAERVGVSPRDAEFSAELRRLIGEKCITRERWGDGVLRYRLLDESPIVMAESRKTSLRHRIVRLLESNDRDFSNADICTALGGAADAIQVTHALNNLRRVGVVVNRGRHGAGRWMHAGHAYGGASA